MQLVDAFANSRRRPPMRLLVLVLSAGAALAASSSHDESHPASASRAAAGVPESVSIPLFASDNVLDFGMAADFKDCSENSIEILFERIPGGSDPDASTALSPATNRTPALPDDVSRLPPPTISEAPSTATDPPEHSRQHLGEVVPEALPEWCGFDDISTTQELLVPSSPRSQGDTVMANSSTSENASPDSDSLLPTTSAAKSTRRAKNPSSRRRRRRTLRVRYISSGTRLADEFNFQAGEIHDYDSLCRFLRKSPDPDELQFLNGENELGADDGGDLGGSVPTTDIVIDVNGVPLRIDEMRRIGGASTTLQKLILLANLYRKLDWALQNSELKVADSIGTSPRAWLYETCRPVLRCVVQCCGRDLRAFQTRWGNPFPHWMLRYRCDGVICRYEQPAEPSEEPTPAKTLPLPHGGRAFRNLDRWRHLFDLDVENITDYATLCAFLKKEPDPDELAFLESSRKTMFRKLMTTKDVLILTVKDTKLTLSEFGDIAAATSSLQKLILIASLFRKLIWAKTTDQGVRLGAGLADFMARSCNPVLVCLSLCCQKDLRTFQSRWGNPFPHSHFKGKCSRHNSDRIRCGFEAPLISGKRRGPLLLDPFIDMSGQMDFIFRYQVRGFQTKTLVECLRRLLPALAKHEGTYTTEMQAYLTDSVYPILDCVRHHCRNDIILFCCVFGPYVDHYQFRQNHCPGPTGQCKAQALFGA